MTASAKARRYLPAEIGTSRWMIMKGMGLNTLSMIRYEALRLNRWSAAAHRSVPFPVGPRPGGARPTRGLTPGIEPRADPSLVRVPEARLKAN